MGKYTDASELCDIQVHSSVYSSSATGPLPQVYLFVEKQAFPRISWHWSQREYGQTYHQDVPLCSGESVEGYFTSTCAYSGKTEKGGVMQGESFTGELGLEH